MKDHRKRRRWITPPPSQIASSPPSSPDHPGQLHYSGLADGGQAGFESVEEILERVILRLPMGRELLAAKDHERAKGNRQGKEPWD